jgi:hypothetical protein
MTCWAADVADVAVALQLLDFRQLQRHARSTLVECLSPSRAGIVFRASSRPSTTKAATVADASAQTTASGESGRLDRGARDARKSSKAVTSTWSIETLASQEESSTARFVSAAVACQLEFEPWPTKPTARSFR